LWCRGTLFACEAKTWRAARLTHSTRRSCGYNSERRDETIPTDYGRIIRDSEGRVQRRGGGKSSNPEQPDDPRSQFQYYCFTLAKLWPCLKALRRTTRIAKLYLTDAIGLLRERK